MVIAEIIKFYQYKVYLNLIKIYDLDYPGNVVDLDTIIRIEIEEDESPEFLYYKRIMEERRGVVL